NRVFAPRSGMKTSWSPSILFEIRDCSVLCRPIRLILLAYEEQKEALYIFSSMPESLWAQVLIVLGAAIVSYHLIFFLLTRLIRYRERFFYEKQKMVLLKMKVPK